jgi:hypothetical protein
VRDPNLALEAADTLLVDSALASAVGNVKGVKPAGTRTDTWPTQARAQAQARPRLRPRPRPRSRSRCCGYAGHHEAVGGARSEHPDGAARLWMAAQRAGCAHARRPPAAGGRWGIADIVGKGETRANDPRERCRCWVGEVPAHHFVAPTAGVGSATSSESRARWSSSAGWTNVLIDQWAVVAGLNEGRVSPGDAGVTI